MVNAQPAIYTTYYKHLSPEDAIRALIKGGFHYGDFNYKQEFMLLDRGENPEKQPEISNHSWTMWVSPYLRHIWSISPTSPAGSCG